MINTVTLAIGNNMKIHPFTVKEFRSKVKENAKKFGLDQIDFEATYTMHKTKAKKKSELGYEDAFYVGTGVISLLGDEEAVVLWMDTPSSWFKTSQIVKCKEIDGKFEIETRNSIYVLEKV